MPPIADGSATGTWEAVVTVDPTLDVDPDPQLPCPVDEPERRFPIDLSQLLVGRRDERRDIRPEIPVRDPAVSHRHAHFLQTPDGVIAIRDLASTNGTFVNGNEIPPGTTFVLQEGDVVTLGRWTKITLRRG
jgi:pSer/pThr/pTyr-binding forkhead associated (FHA) protein